MHNLGKCAVFLCDYHVFLCSVILQSIHLDGLQITSEHRKSSSSITKICCTKPYCGTMRIGACKCIEFVICVWGAINITMAPVCRSQECVWTPCGKRARNALHFGVNQPLKRTYFTYVPLIPKILVNRKTMGC